MSGGPSGAAPRLVSTEGDSTCTSPLAHADLARSWSRRSSPPRARAGRPSARPSPRRRTPGKLAFVRSNQIYTATTTGGAVRQLTTSGKNYRPHWSPGRHADRLRPRGAGGSPRHLGDEGRTAPPRSRSPIWATPPSRRGRPTGSGSRSGRTAPRRTTRVVTTRCARSVRPRRSAARWRCASRLTTTHASPARWPGRPTARRSPIVSNSFPDSPDHYLLVYTLATQEVEDGRPGRRLVLRRGDTSPAPTWTTQQQDDRLHRGPLSRLSSRTLLPPHLQFAEHGRHPAADLPGRRR